MHIPENHNHIHEVRPVMLGRQVNSLGKTCGRLKLFEKAVHENRQEPVHLGWRAWGGGGGKEPGRDERMHCSGNHCPVAR